jgi:hypothetical protein
MRFVKPLASAAISLLTFAFFAIGTPAQAEHPAYLHALSNLRQARALLDTDNRPGFREERNRAIDEIESAIREVRQAVREEGREARFTPPPATPGDPERPMRSALQLLDEANRDVARGEDERDHRGLQERALRHIDEARHSLRHAMHMVEGDHDRDRDRDRRY